MHPKGGEISNMPLAFDLGQIVRRPHLQRPGRKCPLFDRGAQKPPDRSRPTADIEPDPRPTFFFVKPFVSFVPSWLILF